MPDRVIEELDEDTCLQLISGGGVGRLAYASRFGPAVLPVNYALHDGAVVFRTAEHGPLDEDLRTGIGGAEYRVAFEIDDIDLAGQQGWSVCGGPRKPPAPGIILKIFLVVKTFIRQSVENSS